MTVPSRRHRRAVCCVITENSIYIDRGRIYFVLDNVQLAWVFGQSRPPDDEERLRVVEAQRRRRRVAAPELPEAEDVVLVRVADDSERRLDAVEPPRGGPGDRRDSVVKMCVARRAQTGGLDGLRFSWWVRRRAR